jgi:hypothetical protein
VAERIVDIASPLSLPCHYTVSLSTTARAFGGVKRSGWGREYAEEGLAEYVQTCVVHAPAAFRAGGAGLSPTAYPS